MNARARGWCPSALRPMPSGDGLIVRLRISCGEASLALAREIAHWAREYGNGEIDLSARGNLQLRGVSEATLPPLSARLAEAGLIDAAPEAEAVRNVVASPFAGLDGACDVRPYARAWEAELSGNRALWALPEKFGASFDAGAFPLGVEADLMFTAVASETFVVRLGGAAEIALGAFPGDRLVAVATALARTFLAQPKAGRMRDAVRLGGVAPFAQSAGLTPTPAPPWPVRARGDWIGAHALGPAAFVGVALPFGRIAADDLHALADRAAAAGGATLRLTPWRAILAPLPSLAGAEALAEATRALILDPDDPLLAVAACPGAPACSSALGETRSVARDLAPVLPRGDGVALHVSGCAKGCAHPAAAPLAIVATARGYDLVVDGRADAEPVRRGLSPEALRRVIEEIAR
jgi:precorrin-3B synthase